ncbi:hypothetical protein ACNKHS_07455 [Shigella flexneri]
MQQMLGVLRIMILPMRGDKAKALSLAAAQLDSGQSRKAEIDTLREALPDMLPSAKH